MTLEQIQHYRELMNIIDFFSQRLHREQIVHYGYKIFEDLTLLRSGGIYTLNENEDSYVCIENKGYNQPLPAIQFKEIHHEFARKNGFLLDHRKEQSRYFDDGFLGDLEIDLILPLITEDKLFGFIIATENDKPSGIKNREFLNRFNDLLNLSLEKAESYEKTAMMKREIDKRKFNLDSFSQTMRILMTALDQQYIVKMCLDVVRELTSSSVTAIALETRANYLAIAGYKDIVEHKECLLNLLLKEDAVADKVVYHIEDDFDELCTIFENPEDLKQLEATCVVLLVKERIIGCITIGKPVSGNCYDRQLLEQIKSLAEMMYIAINNANQFKLLKEERNKIATQLNGLKHLNRSISIINCADSLEELSCHVIDTLRYGLGVEQGFIRIKHEDQLLLKSIGRVDDNLSDQEMNWLIAHEEPIVEYMASILNPLTNDLSNCFVSIPVKQKDYHQTCMGHIVVTQTVDPLDESKALIIDALANSISPMVKQFLTLEVYKEDYIKKPEIIIKETYERYVEEADFYELPFYIYVRKNSRSLFAAVDQIEKTMLGERVTLQGIEVLFTEDTLDDETVSGMGYEQLHIQSFAELRTILMNKSMK